MVLGIDVKYLPDIVAVFGLGSLGAGLWLYRPWVSLSVVGVLLIVAGLMLGKGERA